MYKAAIAVIPNKTFTFGKIWILAAHLEVRQKDLSAARKILGMAIGEERSTEELPTIQYHFLYCLQLLCVLLLHDPITQCNLVTISLFLLLFVSLPLPICLSIYLFI